MNHLTSAWRSLSALPQKTSRAGVSTAALLSLSLVLAACSDTTPPADTDSTAQTTDVEIAESVADESMSESERVNAFFEKTFEDSIARSPSSLTFLGRSERMGEWDDISPEFAEETLAINKQELASLLEFDFDALDEPTKLSFQLAKQGLEEQIEDHRWRLYNYPVNQMFGTHSFVPSMLINQHRVNSLSDAQAFVSRLNGLKPYFDQLIKNIDARTAIGIIPPKFVFPHVIRDSQNIITGAPFDDCEDSAIFSDFKAKIAGLAAAGDDGEEAQIDQATHDQLLADATAAMNDSVKPAYEALIAKLANLEAVATTDDGVWKWKNGAEYFDVALKRTTTTDLTAEEIHQIGLDEVARIHDEMRQIKETVGFESDLSAFMQHMRDSDEFYSANDQEGKDRYLAEATALIDTMKGRLDELFLTKPKADLNVKAVEAFREKSAGKAFYQRPSEDGTRPGLYYANLYDMRAMPTYQMEALAYHEGIPGHHMQLAIQQELKDIPKFRKFGGYTAYIEGWGLYSEFLPKEIGMYSDPYSDFGRLAMELWRACRLVVDTGIHTKKWTREDGIKYYTDNTPNAVSDGVKMVERHIVMPSQATAYKIGMLKILELRENAKAELGDAFDIRAFHDEILKYGPLPLSNVEDKINEWVAAVKAKA